MKTLPITDIQVSPNRQRKLFDPAKLHEFADGLGRRGLLHPIVLREEGGQMFLVAGERRLRAVSDMADLGVILMHEGEPVPLGHIPYTLFTDLDPLAAEEAELEENVHRVDLTWQERAAATTRLHDLRTRQAAAKGTTHGVADTARERFPQAADLTSRDIGYYQDNTRKELLVAKHLDNPLVSGAKNVDEAFKLLKRAETATRNRELGASVGRSFTADAHQLVHANALEWLLACQSEQFDCILTDPPYGMGADEFGDSNGIAAGAHGYVDDRTTAERCYRVLATEGFRIAKPQAHLYAFCDIDLFPWLKDVFAAAGWAVFRTPLLWYKRHGARAPWPEQGPQRKYEVILYCVKGKRPILKMAGDVLDYPADENLGHGAQKPVALYQDLLSRSCLPGHSVCDPFCGTGPVFPAAHALKVRATGVELDQVSYGIGVKRINDLRTQMSLDAELGL